MWEDSYRLEQDDIKAPEFLKNKVVQQMKDSKEESKSLFAVLKMKTVWGLAVSFLVVVVVALNWINIFESSEPMTDLIFERIDGGLRYFTGIRDSDIQGTELADIETILGISVSNLYLEGFVLDGTAWVVDGDDVRVQYFFEQESSSIRVMINNHTDSVTTNSILNDLPLALYYQIMLLDTTYIAEFLHNGVYFQIEAIQLTEEEFIEHLEIILDFLN